MSGLGPAPSQPRADRQPLTPLRHRARSERTPRARRIRWPGTPRLSAVGQLGTRGGLTAGDPRLTRIGRRAQERVFTGFSERMLRPRRSQGADGLPTHRAIQAMISAAIRVGPTLNLHRLGLTASRLRRSSLIPNSATAASIAAGSLTALTNPARSSSSRRSNELTSS